MLRQRDTGLHVSMRLLLGIVAGLLISDMLKAAVKTIAAGGHTYAAAWTNALTAIAAILFLIRIVVDNVLYYNDPDARTLKPAYGARVALIFMDLCSYGICYHMVTVIEPAAGKPLAFPTATIRFVPGDIALVELLHFAWCLVAIIMLPVSAVERASRVPLLRRWAWLSGSFAVVSALAWLLLPFIPTGIWSAVCVFALSVTSAATYMFTMREQQYLGPATAWQA